MICSEQNAKRFVSQHIGSLDLLNIQIYNTWNGGLAHDFQFDDPTLQFSCGKKSCDKSHISMRQKEKEHRDESNVKTVLIMNA